MNIAIFHELHSGGARRAVNEFSKRLKHKNVIDLYLVDESIDKNEKKYFNNIIFYKFLPKKWTGGDWKAKLYKDTLELFKLYRLHKKIAHDINKKKYDVAFIHPSQFTQAPFLLRFLKIKKIYYCQEPLRMAYESGFAFSQGLNSVKKIYETFSRWLKKYIDSTNIHHANIILANSKNTQKNISSAYNLKSDVCYLGVDTEVFKQQKLKKDIDILFIGGNDKIDGLDLLNESVSLMKIKPKIKTHISGDNWIDDKSLAMLYSRAKIVVCLAKNEPFGLTPLEAMACGTVVVAVNEGGYKETIIDGSNGFLVPRDPRILAKKLEYLLKNNQTRIQMEKNAVAYVKKYWTWDESAKKLERILNLN